MTPLRPTALGLALLLGLAVPQVAGATTQDPAPPPVSTEEPAEPSLDARFEALEAELQAAMDAFIEAYRAAYDAGEAESFKRPHPFETFTPKFAALAEEGCLPAMAWMVENYNPGSDTDIAGYLEQLFANDDQVDLENLLMYLHYRLPMEMIPAETADAVFASLEAYVMSEDPVYAIPSQVALARLLVADPANEERFTRGIAAYERLIKMQARWAKDEAEPEAKRAQALHDTLQGELFVLTKLRVGLEAPEWVGQDVDGNAIKLSDYRGKVTVLEFWGFW